MQEQLENPEHKPLRPGVVPVLFNLHSLNLFMGRIYNPNGNIHQHWSTVEGGIEAKKGETAYKAARRELREEVGLKHPTFIAALTDPMAYSFEGHPRYSGKSLTVLFYGFTPGPRRYLDLDPWDTNEQMAFTTGRFSDPVNARKLLNMGATAERQDFCNQLADRIGEVHLAMQFSTKRWTETSVQLVGERELVKRTQEMLIKHGAGYTIDEKKARLPPLSLQPSIPPKESFLRLSIGMYNCMVLNNDK